MTKKDEDFLQVVMRTLTQRLDYTKSSNTDFSIIVTVVLVVVGFCFILHMEGII